VRILPFTGLPKKRAVLPVINLVEINEFETSHYFNDLHSLFRFLLLFQFFQQMVLNLISAKQIVKGIPSHTYFQGIHA